MFNIAEYVSTVAFRLLHSVYTFTKFCKRFTLRDLCVKSGINLFLFAHLTSLCIKNFYILDLPVSLMKDSEGCFFLKIPF